MMVFDDEMSGVLGRLWGMAKVLAEVYYGSTDQIIRFDMAEYAGSEGLERLIGSVNKNLPGALTTAIKNNPASLLLLDEIEKASSDIFNLFLAMLDEGYITDAFGKQVNCRNLFVIGTSNAGAEYIRTLVTKGAQGEDLQTNVVNYVLEQNIFSPELLNRFDGVVVFEPLSEENLTAIARLMLANFAKGLETKNIHVTFDEPVYEKLARDGFDPAFGARPMRRIVSIVLGDLIGRGILSGEIKEGYTIKITALAGKEQFAWERV
jgi:ATP-dependent Clp protease ATP-binding subunit ClpC